MAKVTFVGAGSVVFARNLTGDLLGVDALRDSTELVLMDIDAERLRTSELAARRVADALGSRARIEATTDRRRAVDGADDVVTMMQVGGYRPATVTDFEVPKRYGLRQTIGDTLGVGGIMRAPRRPGRARRQPRARLPRGDAHPHTAAELSLEEIRRLVDDLLDAHGELIPEST